jgi:mono/diheme cytochrome c family protein
VPGSRFCHACGHSLDADDETDSPTAVQPPPAPPTLSSTSQATPPAPRRRRRTRIVLGVVLVLLAAGGAAAAVFVTVGSHRDASPTTVTVRTPARTLTRVAQTPTPDGRTVFLTSNCGGCHVLADADATGAVGPNLDELAPSAGDVAQIVRSGSGAMPAFAGQLSQAQIAAVAQYVADVATGVTPVKSKTVRNLLPAESRADMTAEIQALLLQFHQDIVARDSAAAWQLLSARKQHHELATQGYAKWVTNQETLAPYLDPSGIRVRILATDAASGVATVAVTGMTWSAPGAKCSEWSGITWVKYEHGAWKYDPGYSTTAARERAWKPRYDELLGTQC